MQSTLFVNKALYCQPWISIFFNVSLLPLPVLLAIFSYHQPVQLKKNPEILFLHNLGVIYQGDLLSTFLLDLLQGKHITSQILSTVHHCQHMNILQFWKSIIRLAEVESQRYKRLLLYYTNAHEQHYFPIFCNIVTCQYVFLCSNSPVPQIRYPQLPETQQELSP